MTVIFHNLKLDELFSKLRSSKTFKFIKTNKIAVRIVTVCFVFFLALIVGITSSGIRVGFNVQCAGKVVATVENPSVYNAARSIAVDNVCSDVADEGIFNSKLAMTLTVGNGFDDANSVAEAIIENTDEIVEATVLVVDGKEILVCEKSLLDSLLNKRLNSYNIEGADNSPCFTATVSTESGYYLKEELADSASAEEYINTLEVKNTAICVKETVVEHETQYVKSYSYAIGYYKVTTEGEDGLTKETKYIESINGEYFVNSTVITEVVSEPVTEVILAGASSASYSASSAGLINPLKGSYYVVTSYYGDGRNHKGVDLGADSGTSIRAAAQGTVVFAGWYGDYGYCVTIDHGNGMLTRYAHNSANYVKTGDVVSQGDVIAAVGTTGQSTGNHLHFEVIINSVRVNPAPYIGL